MRFKNWWMRRFLLKKVKQNQKLKPIILENIFAQTGLSSGSRERYRELVRIRDNHTCQLCDQKWRKGDRRLDTHHISGGCDLTRMCDKGFEGQITLCHKCHLQTDAWKMRGKKSF